VQAGIVRPAVAKFGERRTLVSGLIFGAVGFAIYGLAPTGTWFAVGIPIMSCWGLYGPAAQGLMTRRVEPSEQGQLQGALTSVQSLTGIVGPMMFAPVFASFITTLSAWQLPGAPFLLASALLVAAILLAWRVTRGAAALAPERA